METTLLQEQQPKQSNNKSLSWQELLAHLDSQIVNNIGAAKNIIQQLKAQIENLQNEEMKRQYQKDIDERQEKIDALESSQNGKDEYLKGKEYWAQGKYQQAQYEFAKAMNKAPHNLFYIGNVVASLQKVVSIIEALKVAEYGYEILKQTKDQAPKTAQFFFYKVLAAVMSRANRYEHAIEYLEEALKLNDDPDNETIKIEIASCIHGMGDYKKAQQMLIDIAEKNGNPITKLKAAMKFSLVPESNQEITEARKHLEKTIDSIANMTISSDNIHKFTTTPFYLAYHNKNNKNLQSKLANLFLKIQPELGSIAPHCKNYQKKQPGETLKVGFISRYFFDHSVGRCFNGIIKHLKEQSDNTIKPYMLVEAGSEDDSMKKTAENTELLYLPPDYHKQKELIANLELDAIFYLDIGMDMPCYFLAMARLAPLQAVMTGHPDTTGIPNLDYFMSIGAAEPKNAEEHYTEQLWRTKHLPIWAKQPDIAKLIDPKFDRKTLGMPENGRIYICPMLLQKIHPDFDWALAEILNRDDDSYVMLFNNMPGQYKAVKARLDKSMQHYNVRNYGKRILWSPFVNKKCFANILLNGDVLLDSWYFGSGSTSFMQLALGVPMVTMPGKFLRGRMLSAYYKTMGVKGCIANSKEQFVQTALNIANDKQLYNDIKERILANNDVIFEDTGITKELVAWLGDKLYRQ